jgi:rhodanese-related sulfurtransferase
VFKDAIYGQLARIGKATSTPRRLELLDLLRQAPRTVEELARESGQSVANTSHHLRELRSHGLVESEKNGLYVTYRIAGEEIVQFLSSLRVLAESQLGEIRRITERFIADHGDFEGVGREALLERVKKRGVMVLDVRPRAEYDAGHLAGAISVPLSELKRRLRSLPRNREIVAYCRGRYCLMAIEAVELLRAKGFRATRVDLGVPEWRELGFPIETTAKAVRP